MSDPEYETHTNAEPVRKCPYCPENSGNEAWTGPGRGLTFHVLNTADDAHGEKYDLPAGFDAEDATIVGHQDVSVRMPSEYNVERRTRYVCDFCGKVCHGEAGLNVHLSHTAGDDAHPADAAKRDPVSFPSFEVDADGDLIAQDENALAVATGGAVNGAEDQEAVPVAELKNLRDAFLRADQTYDDLSPMEAAEEVEALLAEYATDTDPASV